MKLTEFMASLSMYSDTAFQFDPSKIATFSKIVNIAHFWQRNKYTY